MGPFTATKDWGDGEGCISPIKLSGTFLPGLSPPEQDLIAYPRPRVSLDCSIPTPSSAIALYPPSPAPSSSAPSVDPYPTIFDKPPTMPPSVTPSRSTKQSEAPDRDDALGTLARSPEPAGAAGPRRTPRRTSTSTTSSTYLIDSRRSTRRRLSLRHPLATTGDHGERSMMPVAADTFREGVPVSAAHAPSLTTVTPTLRTSDIQFDNPEVGDRGRQEGSVKSKEEKLMCPQCPVTVGGRYELDRHIRTVHTNQSCLCPRCGDTLSRSDAVGRHLKRTCGRGNKRGPKPRSGR